MSLLDLLSRGASYRPLACLAVSASFGLLVAVAEAAPCAGFDDVPTDSAFCGNVEWVKNRGITLGCTTGLYCPDQAVSRLAMAAFMNRLGSVVSPSTHVAREAMAGATLGGGRLCETTPLAAVEYARQASVDLRFSGSTVAPARIDVQPIYAAGGSDDWRSVTNVAQRAHMDASRFTSISEVGTLILQPGMAYRFALMVIDWGYPPAQFKAGDCVIRITVFNHEPPMPQ